jgi:2-polyprenyl-3-methyl-5-hydroxy-6-metoxy-1,4-benzoquinol methylase
MNNFDPDNWDLHWKQNVDSASLNPAQIYRHQLVASLVASRDPESVVDIGCGQGDFLQFLAAQNSNIGLRGIELSKTGTEITQAKVGHAVVLQADILDQSFNPAILPKSSLGTCIEVLEHLDDASTFLQRAAQLIQPCGTLIITVPSGPRTAFDIHIGHRRHFSRQSLTALLHECGLKNISVERYGWPFFNLYRTLVLIRGKKLINDVETNSVIDSRLTGLVAKFFSVTFKMNLRTKYFGWQLVATCTVNQE